MFDAEIGDTVTLSIARNGGRVEFIIAGWYEEGSSMIGMEGSLICEADRAALERTVLESGIDALAQEALHIFRTPGQHRSMAEWGERLNTETSLPLFTQFSHSTDTISGFMLILQNAFAGLPLAFTAVLLVFFACLVGRLNAWPGLYGILGAMLLVVTYAMIALVVLVIVSMAEWLLSVERRDLGLYRAMGVSAGRLRPSFAPRFVLVSPTGRLWDGAVRPLRVAVRAVHPDH